MNPTRPSLLLLLGRVAESFLKGPEAALLQHLRPVDHARNNLAATLPNKDSGRKHGEPMQTDLAVFTALCGEAAQG